MDDQLWEKVQMFIDAGQIGMVVHLIVKEFEAQLSEKQFEQLGDLQDRLINIFSGDKKPDLPAKVFIDGFIDLIKRGAIVGVDKTV